MATNRPNISSSRLPNDGGPEELDSLSNSELISFLESSFRRSEFIRVAGILKSREDVAKAEAVKDLYANLYHIKAKLDILGKHAREKIRVLTEEVEKERANCLRLDQEQLELKKAMDVSIAEINSWKSKYSKLEAWILHFLDDNPHLIQKVREHDINGVKSNMDFLGIGKAAGESLRSNAASEKKESFLAARAKSKAVIDIELIGDSFDDKICRKRKLQIGKTSGVKRVIESDDEDDVICISELMLKRFAKRIK